MRVPEEDCVVKQENKNQRPTHFLLLCFVYSRPALVHISEMFILYPQQACGLVCAVNSKRRMDVFIQPFFTNN